MTTRARPGRALSFGLRLLAAGSLVATAAAAEVKPIVETEETVTRVEPANNGAGPTWCYGSSIVVRRGDDVFASVIETGKDVPPLCNTRWQLWRRTGAGWKLAQQAEQFREREPCPIAALPNGGVFLSVNPSTQPPGTKYGACRPLVLEFDPAGPATPPRTHRPAWADGATFTDHSYRGFAADGPRGELLLLNIDAKTGAQFVSWRDDRGEWHPKGRIEFPIRSCYPQVALRDRAAHVLAIGDIVEPVEEWRALKREKTKQEWDYVFRRLFYTWTPRIADTPFASPIEVDTVEQTAGHISNLDLHVDAAGDAHLLYLRRPHQHEFIRDRYFPGQPMTTSLVHVVVREGKVAARSVLAEAPGDPARLSPAFARFHVAHGEEIFVVATGTGPDEAGKATPGMFLARLLASGKPPAFVRVPLRHPFGTFFVSSPRVGATPGDIVDLFGTSNDGLNLRYARVRLVRS